MQTSSQWSCHLGTCCASSQPLREPYSLARSSTARMHRCSCCGASVQDEYKPGALGFDPLGLYPDDPAEQYDIETKELNNGRLAMIGIAGFVAQELVDGKPLSQGLFKSINNKPGL